MSLPLLYAMQAGGGDVRGQYYSNDTSLSEIDDTLSAGNFVGYVELSENVLSGDYYVVYYGGRALPVAFVGNNNRLLSGDEAFERADDEVGIYSVVDADVEVVDLPERPEGDAEPEPESTDNSDVAITPDTDTDDDADGDDADDGSDAAVVETDTDDGSDAVSADADAGSDVDDADTDFSSLGDLSGVDGEDDESVAETEASSDAPGATAESAETTGESDGGTVETAQSTSRETETADAAAEESDADVVMVDSTAEGDGEAPSEALDRLRRELDAAREAKADAEAARDRIASERDDLRAEVDRLRDRVTELESEIERLEAEAADDATPERTLTAEEALAGTNLFVRYADKASGTLERAAEGRISESELRDNLRLEYHTEFETEGVTVDGQPFEPFLRATPEHRFAEWLLTAVTYEIRRTDTRADLSKLYEAIGSVDRIDLDGEVDVTVEGGDGETESTTVTFDVVFLNKMGDPLFAAAFDDSRDPTHAGAIRSLLDGAQSVSRAVESFAAAFVVTTSFFDADAMEVAVDATRGGLFSRSSRKSYVKLSRKSGFHLCLVEARDEDFFLTVPEL
jgi:hypothetical protein